MEKKEKIGRLLKKYRLELFLGDEKGCREVDFYEDDGFWGDGFILKQSSVGMCEEMAAPILAVIESIIPYSYDYYYDHLPVRKLETKLIWEKMQEVRLKVLRDPLDPSLGKIAERIARSEFSFDSRIDRGLPYSEFCRQSLYLRRYELGALYKFFLKWLQPIEGLFIDFVAVGP